MGPLPGIRDTGPARGRMPRVVFHTNEKVSGDEFRNNITGTKSLPTVYIGHGTFELGTGRFETAQTRRAYWPRLYKYIDLPTTSCGVRLLSHANEPFCA